MTIEVTSGPTSEPVTLQEAKDYCNIDFADHDDMISGFIATSRFEAEKYTERSLFTQTKTMYLDKFPDVINLYEGPFQSVTSIQYYDADNTLQAYGTANYRTDLVSKIGRIEPVSSWPSAYDRLNSVIVTYVAGYSSVSAIPEIFKTAIKLKVREMYDNRDNKAYRFPTWFHTLLNTQKVYAEWRN